MSSDSLAGLRPLAIALGLVTLFAASGNPALAQSNGDGDFEGDFPIPEYTPPPAPTPMPNVHQALPGVVPVFTPDISGDLAPSRALDAPTAGVVAGAITQAGRFCKSLPGAYQVDCMSERLETIAASLPRGEGNDEVRSVLNDASRKLETVARQNRDRAQPRISAKTQGPKPVATTRPLVAVRPEAEAEALNEAAAILEEAGALLLRSSAQSQASTEHFQTVASALDSSALLLRS